MTDPKNVQNRWERTYGTPYTIFQINLGFLVLSLDKYNIGGL